MIVVMITIPIIKITVIIIIIIPTTMLVAIK